MPVIIREAQVPDAEAITALSGQLGYDRSMAETVHALQALLRTGRDLLLVAEWEGRVVAWMQVVDTIRLESGRFGEIAGLVVDAGCRGQGIGGILVQAAADWCRERGIPVLRVRSNTKREQAHTFYREAGFTEIKEQKVFEHHLGV